MVETIQWTDAGVVMIDQTRLPREQSFVTCRTYLEVADAIKTMVIRGAPAIGVAAAMGVALGVQEGADFETVCKTLAATRPTAVNLFWAIHRMKKLHAELQSAPRAEIIQRMVQEAKQIRVDDIAICQAIGRHGEPLVPDGKTVLTHCNAGALATAGYGTALGVIRAAVEGGKRLKVLADETRPFLQGARLTAWELWKDDIDVRVISDNMSGTFMRQGLIDAVIVGADRIAANGDVANKIGTYTVAVLARQHDIPFYVAAPLSTLDLKIPDGSHIPIEQRAPTEVTHIGNTRIVPEGVSVFNPAFDVTPNEFVTAIVTEVGVARAPYTESLAKLARSGENG